MLLSTAWLRSRLAITVGLLGFLLLIGLRLIIGERSYFETGPRAWLDVAFAVTLTTVVLGLAGGAGQRIARQLNLSDLSSLELAVFGIPVGLGLIAYGVFALALLGWLQPWVIAAWLILIGLWVRHDLLTVIRGIPGGWLRGSTTGTGSCAGSGSACSWLVRFWR